MTATVRYALCFAAAATLHVGVLALASSVLGRAAVAQPAPEAEVELELLAPPPQIVAVPLPVAPAAPVAVPDPPPPPAPKPEPPPPPEPVPEPPPKPEPKPEPVPVVPVEPPRPPPPPEKVPIIGKPEVPAFQSLEKTTAVVAVAQVPAVTDPVAAPVRTPARNNAAYFVNPAPPYPEAARRDRIEGVVLLRVQVRADGRVREVALHRSSGSALLDRSALAAVRRWRFEPAREDGVAVDSEVEVPIRFALQAP